MTISQQLSILPKFWPCYAWFAIVFSCFLNWTYKLVSPSYACCFRMATVRVATTPTTPTRAGDTTIYQLNRAGFRSHSSSVFVWATQRHHTHLSLGWFKGKFTGNHGFYFLPSNIGLSCKISHHPILWIYIWEQSSQLSRQKVTGYEKWISWATRKSRT